MQRRVRILLLLLIGPILAGFGAVVLQVIATSSVPSWASVLAVAALAGALTMWREWSAIAALWREAEP